MTGQTPPAFPCSPREQPHHGITKREYFSAMAMQGLLSSIHQQPTRQDMPIFAQMSVEMSDALIAELAKEK